MGAQETTYNPSGITVGLREDLSDIITNIAPTETVFMKNIGKTKVKATYHEWLTDTLTAAANCAVTEGMDASLTTPNAQTRIGNYTQVAAKWFAVSDTLEAVDKAGRKSEIAYQTSLFLKMLARDMEYGLLNNAVYTSTDPRSAKGAKGFITTNCAGFTTGTTSTTLTEELFNDAIQSAFDQGGNPNMVITTSALKRVISAFDGNNKLTTNVDASDKKIIMSVDYYESDFGIVKVYISRFLAYDDGADYHSVLFLEKEKWQLGTLIPLKVEKLAKTGLGQKIQISTEYTLVCREEKANARIKNCYVGS